ncbi:hypothetical protein SS50377_28598 [Spironucleus salmonicida]|uniref:Uncharacterized protein n=1 Tax=Spironucleus salmonicida TaxID=348837 RepID=A0A9P8RUF2_9EUKA|nr:hypothetical protein SS50377_28598 [Spironucleus salmonicida]
MSKITLNKLQIQLLLLQADADFRCEPAALQPIFTCNLRRINYFKSGVLGLQLLQLSSELDGPGAELSRNLLESSYYCCAAFTLQLGNQSFRCSPFLRVIYEVVSNMSQKYVSVGFG